MWSVIGRAAVKLRVCRYRAHCFIPLFCMERAIGVKGGNSALDLSFRRSLPVLLSCEKPRSGIALSRNVLFGVVQTTDTINWSTF